MHEASAAAFACLEGYGTYIVALYRYRASVEAVGVMAPAGSQGRTEAVPSQLLAAMNIRRDQESNRWTWQSVRVESGPLCFEVAVAGGRLRVYRLSVGVDW